MLVQRRFTIAGKLALDVAMLATAFYLAFLVRFEGEVNERFAPVLLLYMPFVVAGKMALLALSGRLRLAWRSTGLHDALLILNWLAAATALLLAWRIVAELTGVERLLDTFVPVGVLVLDLALSFLGLIGLRVGARLLSERREGRANGGHASPVPTLLIGAGRAGAMVAKEIAARPDLGIRPIGFLDDDPNLVGMDVGGLPVLGGIGQLSQLSRRFEARQALITIAGGSGPAIRRIAKACERCGLTTKIIPPLYEVLNGRINLSRIRQVAIEDLLRRDPVQMNSETVRDLVSGEVVLVTGAGGSIGSELCRIVSSLAPRVLILVERAENSLYHIHRELLEKFPDTRIVPFIADIGDYARMEGIFAAFRPSLVFHAAAHKHVPMMEWNPSEAVKNNVLGTGAVARLADAWGVARFVMISTDKAVNPSSVMGVSKRVAELYIQSLSAKSDTRFMTVRFGNVLGSAGSVIPIFEQQIARGGPVTVTHPDMMRYFMTIPEACQLVLQAATMGAGGEIFILDMGEPVKIVDIARDLIRLSGLTPDHDIEIEFTGIRPGEKLFEELFLGQEGARRTEHPRIFVGQASRGLGQTSAFDLEHLLTELGELAESGDVEQILAKFKEIVPEYRYQQIRVDQPADSPVEPMHASTVLPLEPLPQRTPLSSVAVATQV